MLRFVMLLAFAVTPLVAFAEDDPIPQALPPEQETLALLAAEKTGMAMFRHDQAAAVATDAGFKVRAFKNDERVRGWITEEQQGSIVVTFVDATPAALHRVTVRNGVADPLVTLDAPVALTPYEAGAVAARNAALDAKFEACSEKYNSVVLPSSVDGQWTVYLLPGTTKHNVVPIGGTYRLEVSGSKVVSQRGFTRTCIALESPPQAEGIVITHVLDPVPTEAHVFWSAWANKPMYVTTPPEPTVWGVEKGRITLVERDGAKKSE